MSRERKIHEQLKKITEERGPISDKLKRYYEQIVENNRKILDCIKSEAKDIPQISHETNLDTKTVLWHLTGLVKYGKVSYINVKTGYLKYKAI